MHFYSRYMRTQDDFFYIHVYHNNFKCYFDYKLTFILLGSTLTCKIKDCPVEKGSTVDCRYVYLFTVYHAYTI